MKWLKSTTDKSYTAQGKVIPSANSAPLAVSDTVFESITSMKVIASLIKTGGIIVLDKYSDPQVSSKDQVKLQQLHTENAKLHEEIERLKASQPKEEDLLKASQYDELKAEAEKALADKDTEIAELKAQLAKKSSKSKSEDAE